MFEHPVEEGVKKIHYGKPNIYSLINSLKTMEWVLPILGTQFSLQKLSPLQNYNCRSPTYYSYYLHKTRKLLLLKS